MWFYVPTRMNVTPLKKVLRASSKLVFLNSLFSLIYRNSLIGHGPTYFSVFVCFSKNLLIERFGRKLMLMGGFILMTVWAVVFTIALWFEVLQVACDYIIIQTHKIPELAF